MIRCMPREKKKKSSCCILLTAQTFLVEDEAIIFDWSLHKGSPFAYSLGIEFKDMTSRDGSRADKIIIWD